MLTYIVLAILILEIARLALALRDARRVQHLNAKALEEAKIWNAEHKALRDAEIADLKAMARDAGKLEQLIEEFKAKC